MVVNIEGCASIHSCAFGKFIFIRGLHLKSILKGFKESFQETFVIFQSLEGGYFKLYLEILDFFSFDGSNIMK